MTYYKTIPPNVIKINFNVIKKDYRIIKKRKM